jgi:nickel/cobalt transporter (NiCoT) family protein
VGGIEALGLASDQFSLTGPFWQAITALNDHFGMMAT